METVRKASRPDALLYAVGLAGGCFMLGTSIVVEASDGMRILIYFAADAKVSYAHCLDWMNRSVQYVMTTCGCTVQACIFISICASTLLGSYPIEGELKAKIDAAAEEIAKHVKLDNITEQVTAHWSCHANMTI